MFTSKVVADSQHGHPFTQNKLVPGIEMHVLGEAANRQTKGRDGGGLGSPP